MDICAVGKIEGFGHELIGSDGPGEEHSSGLHTEGPFYTGQMFQGPELKKGCIDRRILFL